MPIKPKPWSWEAAQTLLHEIRVHLWTKSKNLKIHLRERSSRYLALILSVGIVIRESEMFLPELIPNRTMVFLIVSLAVLTFIAAFWELRGNKLSEAPQDINFMIYMEQLLTRLERFVFGADQTGNTAERVTEFIDDVVIHTCETLCGGIKISGALLLGNEAGTELTLVCPQPKECFQEGLTLQVPNGDPDIPVSPGGIAFKERQITYMPKKKGGKKKECSLLFESIDSHEYQWTSHVHGWVPSKLAIQDDFRSLLCIPVTVYRTQTDSRRFGVLTFSTTRRDPFVPSDFHMGKCFSKILGQMFAYAKLEEEMNGLRKANEELKTQAEKCAEGNQNLRRQLDNLQKQ